MTKSQRARQARATTARGWLAAGAASALGLGLVAASAVSIAGAMPLVDSTTESSVPPITTISLEQGKGVASAGVERSTTAATPPAPSATIAPTASSAPSVQQAPAPAPQPVAPAPVSVSAASPVSVASPASSD